MDQVSKAITELLKQTSIFCASEECRYSKGCGECSLRDVAIMGGSCTSYDVLPEKSAE